MHENLGTAWVQLRGENWLFIVRKRRQTKPLGFLIFYFGTRRLKVQILSPRPIFLGMSNYIARMKHTSPKVSISILTGHRMLTRPREIVWPIRLEPSAVESLYSALQDQLGLRLEARKIPTEFIVIDSAKKPSENESRSNVTVP